MAPAFGFSDFIFRICVKGPMYLMLAAISLLQFKGLLTAIEGLASGKISGNAVTDYLHPLLAQLSELLKQAFGKPSKFSFSLTHVLLMAVLFAVLSVSSAVNNNSTERREQQMDMMRIAKQKQQ
eukprot:CAMPEP_0205819782 /NCGR_PEP_ID=MMETSP0206-20130828/2251_1 /ASSEMBLY_ACC=CAM_ASM_000279 /TAXON_ID=36767 /ORGANISM="Euplotes focardii, Strain TN1" /LENGTH=123 /DNA_ID=CAMNT_0053113739 /DNA_START=34 /DNA_END=405 /DNA_ORIENTATION=+